MQNNDDPLAEYRALVEFGEPGSVADYVATLVARIAELEREVARLKEEVDRLQDAAFHFQTCRTQEDACESCRVFGAYLRGEHGD